MFWRRLAVAVVVLLSAGSGPSAVSPAPSSSLTEPAGPVLATGLAETTPLPAATSAQLLSGQWSTLPAAPISSRAGASVVWSGTELLVWGGVAGVDYREPRADGAAYGPGTGTWRLLPASPLSPRVGQAAVWTGTEMVIWGGDQRGGVNPSVATADGAAYDPATNRWSALPAAPLSPRADADAIWTGAEVVILGGQSTQADGSSRNYGDGAAYDPSTNRWQHIPAPVPPSGHTLTLSIAIQVDGELLAWAEWSIYASGDADGFTISGGADLFAYEEDMGEWRLISTPAVALPDVEEALSTGQQAIARGITYYCGGCPGPALPETTDLYDPARNSWTALPQDPLAMAGVSSAWTGEALFSFNPAAEIGGPSTPSEDIVPGDASVYDPVTNAWQLLPAAPHGCSDEQPSAPVWTGAAVVIYCPDSTAGSGRAGLVFTAGA
jgi:N-acetylneuraminic acid mutarotase